MTVTPDEILRVAWTAWMGSWLAAALWTSRVERRSRTRGDVLDRLLTGAGALLLFDLHPRWSWSRVRLWQLPNDLSWTLVALALAGFALAWCARVALGRLWSSGVTRKVDHELVRVGPYRLVRHPIYSAIFLSVIATAVISGTVAACLGAASMALGLFVKARVEEQFLRRELGADQYDSYARKIPMLVPFRWRASFGRTAFTATSRPRTHEDKRVF